MVVPQLIVVMSTTALADVSMPAQDARAAVAPRSLPCCSGRVWHASAQPRRRNGLLPLTHHDTDDREHGHPKVYLKYGMT